MRTEEPSKICHESPESSVKADASRHFRFELPSRRNCTSGMLAYLCLCKSQECLTRKEMPLAHLERVQTASALPFDQIFHKRLEQRVGIVRIGSNRLGRPDYNNEPVASPQIRRCL